MIIKNKFTLLINKKSNSSPTYRSRRLLAIFLLNKTNWNNFTQLEQERTENTVLIVSVLYNMLKTKLVLKSNNEKELNKINKKGVDKVISDSKNALNGSLI